MALKGRRLRRRLQELVRGDTRFRMALPAGPSRGGSLCPWCGEVGWSAARGERLDEAVAAHIEKCSVARGDPERPLKSTAAMQELIKLRVLTDKFQADLAYRLFGHDGRWVCPYCGEFQDVRAADADGKRRDGDDLVQDISHHLDRCYEYQIHPDTYLSVQQLKCRMAEIGRERKFRGEIKALMNTNPLMQFADCEGKWVCPFCRRSVASIDMSTPIQREHAAPRQVAEHLSDKCEVAKRNRSLTITRDEMEAVVAGINRKKAAPRPVGHEVSADDPGATNFLRALREEVSSLRNQVKRDEELARSMERARQVQRRMLPAELPNVPGYELSHIFRPCERVSGDFYDVFMTPSGRACIVIADVSGHGLDAALVMGMAKKAFSVRAQEDRSAAQIVCKVNADVKPDLEEARFITASLSVLDPASHTLVYARAGHNPAIHWCAATGEVKLMTPPGMMIGVDEGPRFEAVTKEELVRLAPGDVIVQYTDGVTEGTNEAGEQFGVDRLTEAIVRAGAAPADVILGSVTAAIERFCEGRPQDDDVTLLVLRRLP